MFMDTSAADCHIN